MIIDNKNAEELETESEIESETEQDEGITVTFELKNTGEQNILLDIKSPNTNATDSLAVFLTLLETGNLYPEIVKELKQMLIDNPDLELVLQKAFSTKKTIDSNIDSLTIRPSEVFGNAK